MYIMQVQQNSIYHHSIYTNIVLIFIVHLLASLPLHSQTEKKAVEAQKIRSYIRHAMQFNLEFPHEKVYMHFDNTGYFKGETIWFKAYVVRTDDGMPTDLSRILYVELVTPGGDIVVTKKLCIREGMAEGDIKLENIFVTGFYEIRAYTRYMTNWEGYGMFSRTFPIFDSPKTPGDYSQMVIDPVSYRKRLPNTREDEAETGEKSGKKSLYTDTTSGKINVRFYPEGGSLVAGQKSRVAYYITDGGGRHYAAACTLVGSEGDTIFHTETDSMGRGVLELVPGKEPTCLNVRNRKNKQRRFALPEAAPEGCVLSVDAVDSVWITATVRASRLMQGRLAGYALVHDGSVVRCDTFTLEERTEKRFMRRRLPAGVSSIVLFDSRGDIYAERMFFIAPSRPLPCNIHIAPETETLSPHGKVRMSIEGTPETSLSCSVTDVATMPCGKSGNALTWMLLSSEIKGYVDRPEYYFEKDDAEHRAAADMLMMIQGWRRYDWKNAFGIEKFRRVQPIEDGLYLFGRLKKYRSWNKVDGIKLSAYLYNKNGEVLKGKTVTDKDGSYAFRLPDMSGDWVLQILTYNKNDKKKTYRVTIDRNFSPPMRPISPDEARYVPIDPSKTFSNMSFSRYDDAATDGDMPGNRKFVLPTVNVREKKKSRWKYDEARARYWSSIYYDCEKELDRILDNGELLPSVFEFLAQRNPLFNNSECVNLPIFHGFTSPVDSGGKRQTPQKDMPRPMFTGSMAYRNRDIVWLVDNEVAAYSNDRAFACCLMDRAFPMFLDEVKSIYIADSQSGMTHSLERQGTTAIYIYTYPTSVQGSRKGVRRTHFQGFDEPAMFPVTDYSVQPPTEDFRRTIYWNPDVRTDKDGKATVEFYNNSNCTRMYVSAEGMTRDGRFVANE